MHKFNTYTKPNTDSFSSHRFIIAFSAPSSAIQQVSETATHHTHDNHQTRAITAIHHLQFKINLSFCLKHYSFDFIPNSSNCFNFPSSITNQNQSRLRPICNLAATRLLKSESASKSPSPLNPRYHQQQLVLA